MLLFITQAELVYRQNFQCLDKNPLWGTDINCLIHVPKGLLLLLPVPIAFPWVSQNHTIFLSSQFLWTQRQYSEKDEIKSRSGKRMLAHGTCHANQVAGIIAVFQDAWYNCILRTWDQTDQRSTLVPLRWKYTSISKHRKPVVYSKKKSFGE